MRTVIGSLSIGAMLVSHAAELPPITSQVHEAAGTQSEIASRAQLCAIKLLKNDAIRLQDAASSNVFGLATSPKPADTADGGGVIVMADIEGGSVVTKYRFPFRWALVGKVGEVLTTISAKDGRFRLESTGFRTAQLSTGYSANNGFSTVDERSPVVKNLVKAMEAEQEKLVDCIKVAKTDDW